MPVLQKFHYLTSLGILNSVNLVLDRVFARQSPLIKQMRQNIEGVGIEFGGPSRVFAERGYFPVYEKALRIDNVNFSEHTTWHGAMSNGNNFNYSNRKPPGTQIVSDAGSLNQIIDETYDFVISSHMIEHSANPLRLLFEWKRILKSNGGMVLVLPHKDNTFDHRRPITKSGHLLQDFENKTPESDQTHLAEILRLHDLSRDVSQKSAEAFQAWIGNNLENRGAHHHVFNSLVAAQLIDMAGLKILHIEPRRPFDIFVYVIKTTDNSIPDNSKFLSVQSDYLQSSPFESDQLAKSSEVDKCQSD